jgi:anti-anti-sigma factor
VSGIAVEKHSGYCEIQFSEQIRDLTWEQTDAATRKIIQLIQESKLSTVVASAPGLSTLPDGVLGVLLRVWKQLNPHYRKLVFVADSTSISAELESTGLLEHWKLVKSRESALAYLRLDDTHELDMTEIRRESGKREQATSADMKGNGDEPFSVESHRGYCLMQLWAPSEKLSWSDQESMTTAAISQYELAAPVNLMVDLSEIRYINSGAVAGLIRLWKAVQKRQGHYSVVCPNDDVMNVLRASGLTKVWSITDEREESAYDLGVSQAALSEKRERTLLVAVSLPCCLIAAAALIPMFLKRESLWGVNAQLAALLLSAAAASTGLLGILKEQGFRRKLSVFSTVVAMLVLSTVWFKDNPISFRKQLPDYDFRDSD